MSSRKKPVWTNGKGATIYVTSIKAGKSIKKKTGRDYLYVVVFSQRGRADRYLPDPDIRTCRNILEAESVVGYWAQKHGFSLVQDALPV